MEIIAFVVLRIVLAWMFLYPVKGLLTDWKGTLDLVGLICNFAHQVVATLMIIVMITGATSVLLGIYAQVGAAMLLIYSLIGVKVHYKLAENISKEHLGDNVTNDDNKIFSEVKALGIVGNVTSAQKNIVISAALLLIVLLGSGPYSLTENLY